MIAHYIQDGVYYLSQVFYFAMLYYILMSWIPSLGNNAFGEFIKKIVEPYLNIFRRIIPPIGMIDISPIFAFIAYGFLQKYVLMGLQQVFMMLGLW